MSKSKYNLVDPETILKTYGADAARVFMLSDTPPERDLEWTEAGIDGAWRYVNRLWRLQLSCPEETIRPAELTEAADALLRRTHKTVALVTEDLDKLRFNVALARLRELTNAISDLKPVDDSEKSVWRTAFETLVRLLSPIAPHLAEEMWHNLGHSDLLATHEWPKADEAFLTDNKVTLAVQVQGKLRGTIELPADCDDEEAKKAALALGPVKAQIGDKPVRKIIVIKNKIVNVVI